MSSYKQKTKTLKNIQRFELLNRLAFYGCIIPFFYTASCLGQQKSIPTAAKVGSAGCVATVIAAIAIKTKEEKIKTELENMAKQKKNSRA